MAIYGKKAIIIFLIELAEYFAYIAILCHPVRSLHRLECSKTCFSVQVHKYRDNRLKGYTQVKFKIFLFLWGGSAKSRVEGNILYK